MIKQNEFKPENLDNNNEKEVDEMPRKKKVGLAKASKATRKRVAKKGGRASGKARKRLVSKKKIKRFFRS